MGRRNCNSLIFNDVPEVAIARALGWRDCDSYTLLVGFCRGVQRCFARAAELHFKRATTRAEARVSFGRERLMDLLLKSAGFVRRCEWPSYALLRDNVQHFLENGSVTDRFSALHAIEAAVDDGAALVDAAKLRGEVMRAWCSLWQVELSNAAISIRTRARMTGLSTRSTVVGTLLASSAGWALPVAEESGRVPQAAWNFVRAVLSITESAVDGDLVEVERLDLEERGEALNRS